MRLIPCGFAKTSRNNQQAQPCRSRIPEPAGERGIARSFELGSPALWYVPACCRSLPEPRTRFRLPPSRIIRRRCAPGSRLAIWRISTESDCGISCGQRNYRDSGFLGRFSQLCEFGEKHGPARIDISRTFGPLRAGRPYPRGIHRSQAIRRSYFSALQSGLER